MSIDGDIKGETIAQLVKGWRKSGRAVSPRRPLRLNAQVFPKDLLLLLPQAGEAVAARQPYQ